MKKYLPFIYLIVLFLFIDETAIGQTSKKRLAQNINIPTYSHVYPSVSADGQSMIFMSNYNNSGEYELKYTERNENGIWENPKAILNINKPHLDHLGSFYLSHDGKMILFSSARAKGIGGYDIWYCEKRGKYWSTPKNFGKPLNSTGHEGNPSISPDGHTLYFMRCAEMDKTTERNCKIYTSTRISSTRWSDPLPLPDPINTGHEANPRIMIDNQTLIFASNRPGGNGKEDLYMSKKENGSWSQPVSLSFINSERNDKFISLTARADIAYYTGVYKDKFNIFITKIPDNYKPNPVVLLTGKVIFQDTRLPAKEALVKAFDMRSGKLFAATSVSQAEGSFFMELPKGAQYDFAIFPKDVGYGYYEDMMQLDSLQHSEWNKPVIELQPLTPGIIIPLPTICFEEDTDSTQIESDIVIKRLSGFLSINPGISVLINVFTDSIPADSTTLENMYEQDSIIFQPDSSIHVTQPADTILTTGNAPETDSTQSTVPLYIIDPISKTMQQAQFIKDALIQNGIDSVRLEIEGHEITNTMYEDTNGDYHKVIMKILE